LLAFFGAVLAALTATVLSNLAVKLLLTAWWIAYTAACLVQGVRTRRH
jgi:hypothetical protein